MIAFVRKLAVSGAEPACKPGDDGPPPTRWRFQSSSGPVPPMPASDPDSRFSTREAPRYENLPEPQRFGFSSRPNPGIEFTGLTSKLTGPAAPRG
jgi:hypothetical protein